METMGGEKGEMRREQGEGRSGRGEGDVVYRFRIWLCTCTHSILSRPLWLAFIPTYKNKWVCQNLHFGTPTHMVRFMFFT